MQIIKTLIENWLIEDIEHDIDLNIEDKWLKDDKEMEI